MSVDRQCESDDNPVKRKERTSITVSPIESIAESSGDTRANGRKVALDMPLLESISAGTLS